MRRNWWRTSGEVWQEIFGGGGGIVRSIFHQNSTANFTIELHYEVVFCYGGRLWPSVPFSFFLRWHVCRVNFARRFFSSHEFSSEKCSEIFPEKFEPLFCGSEKNPRKIPSKFPTKFFKFPCDKIKKKNHRRASAGAQGELLPRLGRASICEHSLQCFLIAVLNFAARTALTLRSRRAHGNLKETPAEAFQKLLNEVSAKGVKLETKLRNVLRKLPRNSPRNF